MAAPMRGSNPTPTAKRFNSTGIDMEETSRFSRAHQNDTIDAIRTAKSSQRRQDKTKDFAHFGASFERGRMKKK
jgi:hypothetical protein